MVTMVKLANYNIPQHTGAGLGIMNSNKNSNNNNRTSDVGVIIQYQSDLLMLDRSSDSESILISFNFTCDVVNDLSSSNFFIFDIFIFFHSPRSLILACSLLIAPSSLSLLPPHLSFFRVLNHFKYIKIRFSPILTKALPTDHWTNRWPLKEMQGRI